MNDLFKKVKAKITSGNALLIAGSCFLLILIFAVYLIVRNNKLAVVFSYDKNAYAISDSLANHDYNYRIYISFSKNVISSDEFLNQSSFKPKKYFSITPNIKYSVKLRSRAEIVISPDKSSLKPNSMFEIKMNKGLGSLSSLVGDASIKIYYKRFTLVASNIKSQQMIKTLDKDIYLVFNHPVKISELKKHFSIKKRDKNIEHDKITIERYSGFPLNRDMKKAELRYYGAFASGFYSFEKNINNFYIYKVRARHLEVETFYNLFISKNLSPVLGDLPIDDNKNILFNTYERFKVVNEDEEKIVPEAPLLVKLSNDFTFNKEAIRRSFRIINAKTREEMPILKIEEAHFYYNSSYNTSSYYRKGIKLYFNSVPRQKYILLASRGGLVDEYHQRLVSKDVKVEILDYPPYLSTPLPQKGIFESNGKIFKFPLAYRNLEGLRIKIKSYHSPSRHIAKRPSRTDEIIIKKAQIERNVRKTLEIDLKKYLNNNHGFVKLEVEAANREDQFVGRQTSSNSEDRSYREFFYQFTNLSVTTKYSPKNIFIYVTNLTDPSPVKNAKVSIFSKEDSNSNYRKVFTYRTNSEGYIIINNNHPAFSKLYKRLKRGFENINYYVDSDASTEAEPDFLVIAQKGNDFCELNFNSNTSIDLSNTSVDNTANAMSTFHAFVFTPKGLYKQNEKVLIKGYVRENKNGRIYASSGKKYSLKVVSPDNSTVLEEEVRTNSFGSFSVEYKLPESPTLGKYVISVSSPDEPRHISYQNKVFNGSFMVEAYRARNFEVSLKAGTVGKTYYTGDNVPFRVMAKYLHGGLMRNAKLKYRIDAYPFDFNNFKFRLKKYRFSSLKWLEHGRNYETQISETSTTVEQVKTVKLNAAGRYFGIFKAKVPFNNSCIYKVTSEVEDADRQSIVSSSNVIVHKSRYYIGYSLDKFFLGSGKPIKINLVSARPNGKSAGVRIVTLRFYRVEWNNVRKLSASGYYKWDSTKEYKLAKQIVTTTSGNHNRPKAVYYTPPLPGTYVVTFESRDHFGNRVKNMAKFWVHGTQHTTWKMADNQKIELIRDKSLYNVGDYARIMVKSPYKKVKALVTIEREGVLDSFTTEVLGTSGIIKLRVKESYGANVFVSVMLLQGRVGNDYPITSLRDIYKPTVKIGYTVLYIDQERKKLKIDLKGLKNNYEPRQRVSLQIKVANHSSHGIRSEVGVYVVDEGVLSLIGYKTPNPFYAFHRNKELMVKTADSRLEVVGQHKYTLKGENPGGSGKGDYDIRSSLGISNVDARNLFKAIVYSNPNVVTDRSGYARVSFKLADNLTKYRVMVIAADKKDRFGAVHTHIKVSKPLIARPALPRFLNYKDRLKAGVVVINNQDKAIYATVSAGVRNIKRLGRKTKRVYIPANGSKEVRFDFEANNMGKAEFKFGVVAHSGGKRLVDVVETKIPVNMPFYVTDVAYMSNTVRGYEEHSLRAPDDMLTNTLGVEAITSSTAMSKLKGSVEYLFGYPYGCLEQRMTKVMPMLLAGKLVKEFKLTVGVSYRKLVQKYISDFYRYQTSSGGFSIWPEPRYQYSTNPYLSAYVLYIMHMGEKLNYKVDETVRKKTLNYLKSFLSGENSQSSSGYGRGYKTASNIFVYYILSEFGEANASYADSFIRKMDGLPLYAKSILAKALYNVGKRKYRDVINKIVNEIKSKVSFEAGNKGFISTNYKKFNYYREIYLSDVKTTSSVILTLLKVDKNNALIPKLVRGLLGKMKNGKYRTTQENMYVLWALLSYFETYEKDVPNFKVSVYAEAKRLLNSIFKGRNTNISKGRSVLYNLDKKFIKVKVIKKGKGRLYYTIRLNYVPKSLPSSIDNGFKLEKRVYDIITGREIRNGNFVAGRTYRVELTVKVSDARYDVVVDDPLAAGFEALNPRLARSSLDVNTSNNSSNSWRFGFNRVAMRDDRVCLFAKTLKPGTYNYTYNMKATSVGTFVMYPTKAEEMYNPDIHGYSKSSRIRIR